VPNIPPPRTAIGLGSVPLTVPSSINHKGGIVGAGGRARGFSAPGSFTPLNSGASGWGTGYPRSALPPLTVPSEPSHLSHTNSMPHTNSMYNNSPHHSHPITPLDESPSSQFYANSTREMMAPSSQYPYNESGNWSAPSFSNNHSSNHSGSLSSLLNPSGGGYHSRPTPTINTSYTSPFSNIHMHTEHSGSSLSPDSRPTTGYSIASSVSSLPYDDGHSSHHSHLHHDYSRPNSSHHRPISPSSRPSSSKGGYLNSGSLSVRRNRRHSQAISPYPSPYDHIEQRPSTSPQPTEGHHGSIPRVRSMIQLPSVDTSYGFNPSQAEFAYSAVPGESLDSSNGWTQNGSRSQRPSTSTSSISAASHGSSSQANTPPVLDSYGGGETDINRCKFQAPPS
jgi:hypothetical protein